MVLIVTVQGKKGMPPNQVLVSSRRALAVFQHHDGFIPRASTSLIGVGVTGTAKDPVMSDYGRRMYEAITSLNVCSVDSRS